MLRRLALLIGTLLPLLLLASAARAGGPRQERVAGHEQFAKGTLSGLSLDADGVLHTGPVFSATTLDAQTAWAAAQVGKTTWIGTGNEAALLRVDGQGAVTRIALGPGLMVTAVAPLPAGGVAAAVFPGGRILRVQADGQVEPLATLPVEHVWALHTDGRGGLVAACGIPGSVYAIDPFGAVGKRADVDDDHARCLARGADDTFYVGTAPKGRVLRLERSAVTVLHDLEAQEVVGIVEVADGGLLIAANADQAGGNAQALANLLRQIAEPPPTKPGAKPAPRAALQDGSLVHLEASGVLTTLWTEKKVAVLGLAPDGAGAVAGTYPSGRVLRVEAGQPAALWADLPEAEASVVVGGERVAAVVTSNPAVLHRRQADATTGTWTSAPLDAGARSQWGRVSLWGRDVRVLEARGGETSEPDDAWSAWKPLEGFDGRSGTIRDLGARFVQLRATLEGEDASLRALVAVTRTPNRPPVLGELTVWVGTAKPKEGAPPEATPLRKIAWKVEDADGDRLRTTLEVNRRDSPYWAKLVDSKELEKTEHVWDTTGVPDGTYRVAVLVDDGPDNEPGRERTARRELTGVRVDNTAPTVSVIARRQQGGRLRIEGTATDADDGRVLGVRVSIDGGHWIPLTARDGLFDSAREAFASVLRIPEEGAHDVVVQASDALGNLGATAAVVR